MIAVAHGLVTPQTLKFNGWVITVMSQRASFFLLLTQGKTMKVDFKDVQEDYKRLNAEIDLLMQRNADLSDTIMEMEEVIVRLTREVDGLSLDDVNK